jgi:plastocyanin
MGALALAAGLTLAACSSPSHPAAVAGSSTAISPGGGQSALAGQPGSTSTGAVPAPGDSAMSSMPGMTMSAGGGQGSGAGGAPVAANAVAIKNFAFAPAAITVTVGTTVTWTNQDSDAHTVTSQNNSGPLGSAALNTGQTYSYTFTKPGTYNYLCTIHPFMTATVTVTP